MKKQKMFTIEFLKVKSCLFQLFRSFSNYFGHFGYAIHHIP